jgi:hypothetical protein
MISFQASLRSSNDSALSIPEEICTGVLWVVYATHNTLKPVPTLPR